MSTDTFPVEYGKTVLLQAPNRSYPEQHKKRFNFFWSCYLLLSSVESKFCCEQTNPSSVLSEAELRHGSDSNATGQDLCRCAGGHAVPCCAVP